jgi:hypothetical protein
MFEDRVTKSGNRHLAAALVLGGEALNIRVKPRGAGAREEGHTPMLPAYPMKSLTCMTQ